MIEIEQLQRILNISYPTALNYAKNNGELKDVGHGRGKWYLPYKFVAGKVEELEKEAARARATLLLECANGNGK